MSAWVLFLIGLIAMATLLLSIGKGISIEANVSNMQAGKFVDIDISAIGATGSVTWLLTGTLPPGLVWTTDIYFIGSGDPVIRGVPTTAGDYTFSIKATDAIGYSATRSFSVSVAEADALGVTYGYYVAHDGETLITTNSYSAVTGQPYSLVITPLGGVPPYTFSVVSGSLAVGLSFDPDAGLVSGTPTGEEYAPQILLRLTDAAATAMDFVLMVSAYPFRIDLNGHDGIRGAEYSVQISGNHDTGPAPTQDTGLHPIVWSITSGTLPDGLTLSASGLLSGSPTVVTALTTVTLLAVSAGGASDTNDFDITIEPAAITVTQDLPAATKDVEYNGTVTVSGGYSGDTYTSELISGSLPPGPIAIASSTTNGKFSLSGLPSTVGAYSAQVKFSDGFGNSSTVDVDIAVVSGPLTAEYQGSTAWDVGASPSSIIRVEGGTNVHYLTVHSGSLPPGVTIDPDDLSNRDFQFQGSPNPGSEGSYTVIFRASDDGGNFVDTPEIDITVSP